MRRGWDRGSVVCRGISPSDKSVNIYHFCVDGVGGWYRKRGWFCIARWSQSRWDRSCSRDECCICFCFCVCIENQCCLFVVFRWESSCGCWYKLLTKKSKGSDSKKRHSWTILNLWKQTNARSAVCVCIVGTQTHMTDLTVVKSSFRTDYRITTLLKDTNSVENRT